MKILTFAVALITFFFTNTDSAQQPLFGKIYEFKGVVKDQNSGVLAGTNLLFKGNDKSIVATSNGDGKFSVQLSSGEYEITINRDISSSFIAFIKISESGLNPNNVELIIETSSVCCGQFSDNLYPKLLSFPKPGYPAAARAVRANGEVVVAVKINKEGKVIAASAESGHPLLRTVSTKAAENSKFEHSETVDEREARLTYVFIDDDGEQNLKHYSNPYRTEITLW